jgi:hypothetical protein
MYKYSKILLILLVAVSFVFTGCPDPLLPNGGGLAPGEMNVTASVEGNFFASDAVVDGNGSTYLVKATVPFTFPGNVNGHIEITLDLPKNTPPYTVNVGTTAGALIEYCLEESATVCTIFNAKQGTGSGTIHITSISPYLEGTFSGTLPQVGGSGSRTLTSGEFKAEFP